MTTYTNLHALLSARPVALWVEDMLTKEYLQRIWQPDDIFFQILVAGTNDSVTAVVRDLQENGYGNVFGLTDRDFHNSNRPKWNNPSPNMLIYRPDRLEIENYLLDWPALAGCDENISRRNRTQADIQQRAEGYAGRMLWWMACRKIISDYHERVVGQFPQHPKLTDISSVSEAENYIRTARNWRDQLPVHAVYINNSNNLTISLQSAHDVYQDTLNYGTWTDDFSGKEIFRAIRGFLFNDSYASADVMDTDLAKSVADWQINNNSVPNELIVLKDSIKTRVGMPSYY